MNANIMVFRLKATFLGGSLNCSQIYKNFRAEAPNMVRLHGELPGRKHLEKYRGKRAAHHINAAAAKLWNAGVPLQDALRIVREAFAASMAEV